MTISPHVLQNVGWATLTIVVVIVLNNSLFRVMPGDPARAASVTGA